MVQCTRHILTLTTKIIMGGGGGVGKKAKEPSTNIGGSRGGGAFQAHAPPFW